MMVALPNGKDPALPPLAGKYALLVNFSVMLASGLELTDGAIRSPNALI